MQQTSFLSKLYEIKPFKIVDSPQILKHDKNPFISTELILPLSLIASDRGQNIDDCIPLKILQNNLSNYGITTKIQHTKKLFTTHYDDKPKNKQNICSPFSSPYIPNNQNLKLPSINQLTTSSQFKMPQKPTKLPIATMIESQVYSNLSSSIDTLFSKIQKIKQEFQQNSSSLTITQESKSNKIRSKIHTFKHQNIKQISEHSLINNHCQLQDISQCQSLQIKSMIPFIKSVSCAQLPNYSYPQQQPPSHPFNQIDSISSFECSKISITHLQNIEEMSNKTRSIINQINLLLESSKKKNKVSSPIFFNKYDIDKGDKTKNNSNSQQLKQKHCIPPYQKTQHPYQTQQSIQLYDEFDDQFFTPQLKTTQTQYAPNSKNKNCLNNTNKNYGIKNQICLSSARLGFKIQQPVYQAQPYLIKKEDKLNISIQPHPYQQQTLLKKPDVLTMKHFQLGKCVGSGKFGDVHICRHKATGTLYALKKIFKSTIIEYAMIDQFTRELKIHYKLSNTHQNITKLYAHFQDQYHLFLLMQYMQDGTLMQHLKRSEEFVSSIIEQVLNAVEYLHRNNIAHRDIKPQNILLTNGVIKLCDFGWSSQFNDQMKRTFCGTLDYVSPQMKDKGQYNTSVDLWSIGVLTFQLLVGFPPYKKEIDKWKVMGGRIKDKWKWDVTYPQTISDCARDFIAGILKENPDDRFSIRQCRSHQFIWKYGGNRNQMNVLEKVEQRVILD